MGFNSGFKGLKAPTNVGVVCVQHGVYELEDRHNYKNGYKRI